MIVITLVALPLVLAVTVFLLKGSARTSTVLAAAGTIIHFILTLVYALRTNAAAPENGVADGLALTVLFTTSLLFLCVSLHLCTWLPAELAGRESQQSPEAVMKPHLLAALLLAFLGTTSLVSLARSFGVLWVAVEATTLTSAPLILGHRHGRSLEAMWKYLLICSVGIGLALFGTMLLAVAVQGERHGLDFAAIRTAALSPRLYRVAFIFILAGYGTKMGLAPFHTWLPDAHSEAPGPVSALLSGALLNCSFLGIIRFWEVAPAGEKAFISQLLLAAGFLSLATAALFIIHQKDYKRLLAYSSVEHMGLLALFAACGAVGTARWHLVGHSLVKMMLFLVAGNLLLACGTREIARLGGLCRELPRNAKLWLLGMLFICGLPPSPLFVTELKLLGLLPPVAALFSALLLLVIFAGMSHLVLKMIWGAPGAIRPAENDAAAAEKLTVVPWAVLVLSTLYGVLLLWSINGAYHGFLD